MSSNRLPFLHRISWTMPSLHRWFNKVSAASQLWNPAPDRQETRDESDLNKCLQSLQTFQPTKEGTDKERLNDEYTNPRTTKAEQLFKQQSQSGSSFATPF